MERPGDVGLHLESPSHGLEGGPSMGAGPDYALGAEDGLGQVGKTVLERVEIHPVRRSGRLAREVGMGVRVVVGGLGPLHGGRFSPNVEECFEG